MKTLVNIIIVLIALLISLPLTVWVIAMQQANENADGIKKQLQKKNIVK